MKSLLVGRWQPFHKGHLELVKAEAARGGVIVAICSANKSHNKDNPFTAGERYEMISKALRDEKIEADIISVPDTVDHGLWVELVVRTAPPFDRVVSGNDFVAYLFRERGFKAEKPQFFQSENHNATKIRTLIAEGGKWKELVPRAVAVVIERIGGAERVKFSQKVALPKNE